MVWGRGQCTPLPLFLEGRPLGGTRALERTHINKAPSLGFESQTKTFNPCKAELLPDICPARPSPIYKRISSSGLYGRGRIPHHTTHGVLSSPHLTVRGAQHPVGL